MDGPVRESCFPIVIRVCNTGRLYFVKRPEDLNGVGTFTVVGLNVDILEPEKCGGHF